MYRVLFILVILQGLLFSHNHYKTRVDNYFSLQEYKKFKSYSDFEITRGSIYLNPIGGFSDGKYTLKNSNILKINKHYYKVIVNFKKKKGKYLNYNHNEHFGVLYDGEKFWIKHKGVLKKYYVNSNVKYHYVKKSKQLKRNLHIDIGGMKLVVNFRYRNYHY